MAKITELYGQPTENPEFWKDVSAINFFNNIKAPVLIFHGTNDSSVPYQWSQTLLTKLIELKKDVRLVTYEGEAHEFIPKWPDFMKQTSEFFKTTLN